MTQTHGGPLHGVPGSLARHVGEPHAQPDRRRIAYEATPLAERRHWTREELQTAHRELHEGIPAVRDASCFGPLPIPVGGVDERKRHRGPLEDGSQRVVPAVTSSPRRGGRSNPQPT